MQAIFLNLFYFMCTLLTEVTASQLFLHTIISKAQGQSIVLEHLSHGLNTRPTQVEIEFMQQVKMRLKISDQNFLLQYISIDCEKIKIRIHHQLELNSFLTLENCGKTSFSQNQLEIPVLIENNPACLLQLQPSQVPLST